MGSLLIAFIECGNPVDLFERRSEIKALAESCRLIGHKTVSFAIRSIDELQSTLAYLASSNDELLTGPENEPVPPLVIHLSCHGNSSGIHVGPTSCSWQTLAELLQPLLLTPYKGMTMLSVSSCDSGVNSLSTDLVEMPTPFKHKKYPTYIFSLEGKSIEWRKSLVAWTLLYQMFFDQPTYSPDTVKSAMQQVFQGTGIRMLYKRWDSWRGGYRKLMPVEAHG